MSIAEQVLKRLGTNGIEAVNAAHCNWQQAAMDPEFFSVLSSGEFPNTLSRHVLWCSVVLEISSLVRIPSTPNGRHLV